VAGTAGAVHHRQQQRWANKEQAQYEAEYQEAQMAQMEQQMAQQQAMMEQMQQQQAAQAQSAPPPAGGSDMMTKLQQLADMRTAGILTDEEFAAAKQKLLAGG
jgi:hypothetical protein